MSVTIRQTTRADLADLGDLWANPDVMRWVGFPEGLHYTAAHLTGWYDRITADADAHHFLVAHNGVFCGEVFYRIDEPPHTAGLDIKLLPRARGRGIATQALLVLIATVTSNEPDVVTVWTEPNRDNTAAQRLYARCGLHPAPRPAHLPPGETYWERRLER